MNRIIFIFVDGIGIAPGSDDNPFAHAATPTLRALLGGAMIAETFAAAVHTPHAAFTTLDATLDIPGLPQSGTGQATLLTGENCARLHDAHFGPYPPSAVRPVLRAKNIFTTCVEHRLSVEFVNAFPERYFEHFNAHPIMKPAIAFSYESAGRSLHTADDLREGRAISADVRAEFWSSIGHEGIAQITPREAGARLARIAAENAFTMFEYWLTDKAGHRQDMDAAIDALGRLDGMIAGALDAMKDDTLLVLTSDHGNMEDLSVATHTTNPVPLLAVGKSAVDFTNAAASIIDVAPHMRSLLIGS